MLRTFDVAAAELAAGSLSAERLGSAVEGLRIDGAIVLRGAIDPEHVRVLREKMEADIPELLGKVSFNMSQGQFHQSPPPFAPYVFADVVANPIVTSICEAAICAPVQLTFLAGNTSMPGSEAQDLHRDLGNLWRDLECSHPPAMLSTHIPLVDMDETNGATEIWPGTHRLAHLEGAAGYGLPAGVDPGEVSHADMERPPVQLVCPAGGIVLRDARGWHRGMPNRTSRPRVMLGMVYGAHWLRAGKIPFMRSAEAALRDVKIRLNADYRDEPFDYLEDWKTRMAREAKQAAQKGAAA